METYLVVSVGLVIVLIVVLSIIYSHVKNLAAMLDKHWQNLWLLLYRRHNLVPNLLETFRRFFPDEKKIIEELVGLKAKAAVLSKPNLDKLHAEFDLSKKIAELMDVAKKSQDIMTDTNFLELSHELKQNSYKVEGALSIYNDHIRNYNAFIERGFMKAVVPILRLKRLKIFEYEPEV